MKEIILIAVLVVSSIFSYSISPAEENTASNEKNADTAKENTYTLEGLRTPSCPAVILLGIDPSSIPTFSPPEKITINFLSDIPNQLFPSNYAVEFSPATIIKEKTAIEKYIQPNMFNDLLRSFTISLATSPIDISKASSENNAGTRLGLGLKVNFFIKKSGEMKGLYDELKANGKEIIRLMTILENDGSFTEAEKEAKNTEIKGLKQKGTDIFNKMKNAEKKTYGLLLEFAGGEVLDFVENDFDKAKISKYGGWLTLSYLNEKPKIDIIVLARGLKTKNGESFDNDYDFGTRFAYKYSDLALSFEYIHRFLRSSGIKENLSRYCFNVEYPLSDKIYLTGAFGKDFPKNKEKKDNLIATLTIGFGIGQEKLIIEQ